MADNQKQIDWSTVLFALAPLLIAIFAIIITLPDTLRVPLSCEFMQGKLRGQEEMLNGFQNDAIFEHAEAMCSPYDTNCYTNIIYEGISSTGSSSGINVPMSTSFDNCGIFYLNMLIETDAEKQRAKEDFIKKNRGKGYVDDVIGAYFDIIYAHESVHREQCLKDAQYYLDLKGHREAEIEAYQVSIQKKKEYLEDNCKIYCQCDKKIYFSQEECQNKCKANLSCFAEKKCIVQPVN